MSTKLHPVSIMHFTLFQEALGIYETLTDFTNTLDESSLDCTLFEGAENASRNLLVAACDLHAAIQTARVVTGKQPAMRDVYRV